eukprot:3568683-Rhodomonas_salina.4
MPGVTNGYEKRGRNCRATAPPWTAYDTGAEGGEREGGRARKEGGGRAERMVGAVSGTETAYGAQVRKESASKLRVGDLRSSYAMSGTDIGYAATLSLGGVRY